MASVDPAMFSDLADDVTANKNKITANMMGISTNSDAISTNVEDIKSNLDLATDNKMMFDEL